VHWSDWSDECSSLLILTERVLVASEIVTYDRSPYNSEQKRDAPIYRNDASDEMVVDESFSRRLDSSRMSSHTVARVYAPLSGRGMDHAIMVTHVATATSPADSLMLPPQHNQD